MKRCKDCVWQKECFIEAGESKPDWTARKCGDYLLQTLEILEAEMKTCEIQPEVYDSVNRLYDRYVMVTSLQDEDSMSFPDFINQLLIRGLAEYNIKLTEIEKKLGLI